MKGPLPHKHTRVCARPCLNYTKVVYLETDFANNTKTPNVLIPVRQGVDFNAILSLHPSCSTEKYKYKYLKLVTPLTITKQQQSGMEYNRFHVTLLCRTSHSLLCPGFFFYPCDCLCLPVCLSD